MIELNPREVNAMGDEVKDRAALEATLRFMDERIRPRRCDSDGVSGCWRCQSMYLAKRMRELLDELAAPPVAADTMGDATTDQLIELAGALEQRRAIAIVENVAALSAGYHEGGFRAGFETACEEITLRLRTEVWYGCLPPVDAAITEGKPDA